MWKAGPLSILNLYFNNFEMNSNNIMSATFESEKNKKAFIYTTIICVAILLILLLPKRVVSLLVLKYLYPIIVVTKSAIPWFQLKGNLKSNNSNYEMVAGNKAINLKMLGKEKEADKFLEFLSEKQTDSEFKQAIMLWVGKNKKEILDDMSRDQYSR